MDFLDKIWTFLKTEFGYVYTSVAGIFNTILSEIPDDEIEILHGAFNAAADKLKAGASAEEAMTEGLNYLEAAEVAEGKKLLRDLLGAFVTATAPKP